MRLNTKHEKINAVLIDPFTKTVDWVEVEPKYEALLKLLDAECLDSLAVTDDAYVFVDGEGLLKSDLKHGWIPPGWGAKPIMGKGIVLTCDEDYQWGGYTGDIAMIRAVVAQWFLGTPPEPRIEVWSESDNCRMCGNRKIAVKYLSTGQPLCERCGDALSKRGDK